MSQDFHLLLFNNLIAAQNFQAGIFHCYKLGNKIIGGMQCHVFSVKKIEQHITGNSFRPATGTHFISMYV